MQHFHSALYISVLFPTLWDVCWYENELARKRMIPFSEKLGVEPHFRLHVVEATCVFAMRYGTYINLTSYLWQQMAKKNIYWLNVNAANNVNCQKGYVVGFLGSILAFLTPYSYCLGFCSLPTCQLWNTYHQSPCSSQ